MKYFPWKTACDKEIIEEDKIREYILYKFISSITFVIEFSLCASERVMNNVIKFWKGS